MALKRLDEEFELKPGTQLLPYMKRLLPSLEGRFQDLEETADIYARVLEDIRAAALLRMNEILIPATEDIIAVTKLGFMLAPVTTPYTWVLGYMTMFVDEGVQRDTFTPSPYLLIEASVSNYAIARLIGYQQDTGLIEMTITAIHGSPGPHSSVMISSTAGMADSTKMYHDAVAPMHATVVADYTQIVTMHAEILEAYEDLAESGLDLTAYIRKDGTRPFTNVQAGISPVGSSNDATIPTTSWTRARISEYTAPFLSKTAGGTMTGPLTLAGPPNAPLMAATKAYVDAILGQGGVMNANLTLSTVNPTFSLRPTGTAQDRIIFGLSSSSLSRWALLLGNSAAESGSNAGSNFGINRYADNGVFIDTPLSINRATGMTYANKGFVATGDVTVDGGELVAYRSAAQGGPTTGVLFLNQSKTAYLHYNGSQYVTGGGFAFNTGNIAVQDINCRSIYTNGYPATVWSLTGHGATVLNGGLTVYNNLIVNGPNAAQIRMYDQDWGGNTYIHSDGGNFGFLKNDGNWALQITQGAHIYSPAYGWLHDYVNNAAYNQAVYYAQYYVNVWAVRSVRWVHIGDLGMPYGPYQVYEPGSGSAITGWSQNPFDPYGTGVGGTIYQMRYRQLQYEINGGWYASWHA